MCVFVGKVWGIAGDEWLVLIGNVIGHRLTTRPSRKVHSNNRFPASCARCQLTHTLPPSPQSLWHTICSAAQFYYAAKNQLRFLQLLHHKAEQSVTFICRNTPVYFDSKLKSYDPAVSCKLFNEQEVNSHQNRHLRSDSGNSLLDIKVRDECQVSGQHNVCFTNTHTHTQTLANLICRWGYQKIMNGRQDDCIVTFYACSWVVWIFLCSSCYHSALRKPIVSWLHGCIVSHR